MFQNLKANFAAAKKRRLCVHEFHTGTIIGKTKPPQPHPHPAFSKQYRMTPQEFARVSVCFKCGFVKADYGYNELLCEKVVPDDPAPNA